MIVLLLQSVEMMLHRPKDINNVAHDLPILVQQVRLQINNLPTFRVYHHEILDHRHHLAHRVERDVRDQDRFILGRVLGLIAVLFMESSVSE